MANGSTHLGRSPMRVAWVMAAVALVLVATFVVVRPWAGSARDAGDTRVQAQRVAGTVTVTIPVDGMTCIVCASSVKRTAEGIEGVSRADVDLAKQRATVSYIEGTGSPERIAAAIARLGYKTGTPIVEKGQ